MIKLFPGIEIVAYTDDICILGKFDYIKMSRIAEGMGLNVNPQKCATMNHQIKGLKSRRT